MSENAQQIAVIDRTADIAETVPPQDNSPGALLRVAIERDLEIGKIEKLLELQERWEANAARKAYVVAMSNLKRDDCPIIVKDRKVRYKSQKGLVEYDHSSLAQVSAQCVDALAKHGFHHDWECRQEKGSVEVSCVVTHRQGHSTRKTMAAPPDTSGTKNQIQAIASTVTYLERYTLLMALGLAPADDDDGRASGPPMGPAGKQAPPVDPDPGPTPRARKAISVWGKYLGPQNARAGMERLLGKPASQWAEQDYQTLMDTWAVVRGVDSAADKSAALVSEIDRRVAAAQESKCK